MKSNSNMKQFSRAHFNRIIERIILAVIIIFILVITIYPIIWIFQISFMQLEDFQGDNPFALPKHLNFSNYENAFANSRIDLYFLNSMFITASSIAGILILSSMASFALEKFTFRLKKATFSYFLAGIVVPIHVTLIPLFMIYRSIGILDSYISVILPYVSFGMPMAIYMFTAFYRFIPTGIIEAAIIDGCNVYQLFIKIVIPISTNTIVTIATLNFVFIWNEFVFANTFINNRARRTVILGLQDYVGQWGQTDLGATFSAIAITIIPIFIVYFILNKQIIAGMAAGAIKS